MSCKHIALKFAAPKRQCCDSASNTKVDSEGKGGAPRNSHTMNCLGYTTIAITSAWLWWSPMPLSHTVNFLGSMPPDPPTTLSAIYTRMDNCVQHVVYQSPSGQYDPPNHL